MTDLFSESLHKGVDQYLLSVARARDDVLVRMEQYGLEKKFPLIGPLAGELLSLMARLTGAKQILELGSGYGYSAVYFARAIPPDGKVYCTDGDPENAETAKRFFTEAGVDKKVEYHVGDAVTTLNKFPGPFDIILMDIDKEGYPDAFRAAWPKVRPGGLFIADNLLWHGRVMSDDSQETTVAIREFTKLIYGTPGAQTVIVPVRDGVSVTLKIA